MSEVRNDLKYTKNHEWLRVEGDVAFAGITDYAQHSLGDIVFVEARAVGSKIEAGKSFGTVESVKAAEDLFAPASGEVIEVNAAVAGTPESINKDPYGSWIIKIRGFQKDEIDRLLDAAAYTELLKTLDH